MVKRLRGSKEDKKMEKRNLDGGGVGGRWSRAERSRRLNREEIECSSNIEEDSGFERTEGGTYPSIRPLSDSSGVHRLPQPQAQQDQRFSFVCAVRIIHVENSRTVNMVKLVCRFRSSAIRIEPLRDLTKIDHLFSFHK